MAAGGLAVYPAYVGYMGAAVAVIFFGSNFVPVKQYKTGDGVFFQFIFCIAVWLTSLVLNAMRGFPRFWPFAMLGGALWCSGNILVVPIIQCLGMTIGLLIWALVQMLVGWASGSFGWFGVKPRPASNLILNYFGVALCVLGAVAVSRIKPSLVEENDRKSNSKSRSADIDKDIDDDPLLLLSKDHFQLKSSRDLDQDTKINDIDSTIQPNDENSNNELYIKDPDSLIHLLSPANRKIVGVVMCVIAGAFFGLNFNPVIHIKESYGTSGGDYKVCTKEPCVSDVSPKDLDYVFSHFSGILLTSSLYFIIYCVYMRNKPRVYPETILPAFVSGFMWAIADIGWFLANEALDVSVSFPIICTGPAIVASFWGLFVFKEIQGRQNVMLLGAAFCLMIGGSILSGISK